MTKKYYFCTQNNQCEGIIRCHDKNNGEKRNYWTTDPADGFQLWS